MYVGTIESVFTLLSKKHRLEIGNKYMKNLRDGNVKYPKKVREIVL